MGLVQEDSGGGQLRLVCGQGLCGLYCLFGQHIGLGGGAFHDTDLRGLLGVLGHCVGDIQTVRYPCDAEL